MHPNSGPDITTTVQSISQELGNQDGNDSRPAGNGLKKKHVCQKILDFTS